MCISFHVFSLFYPMCGHGFTMHGSICMLGKCTIHLNWLSEVFASKTCFVPQLLFNSAIKKRKRNKENKLLLFCMHLFFTCRPFPLFLKRKKFINNMSQEQNEFPSNKTI